MDAVCCYMQAVIGAGHQVPSHTRISLCESQHAQASLDEDVEYSAAGTLVSLRCLSLWKCVSTPASLCVCLSVSSVTSQQHPCAGSLLQHTTCVYFLHGVHDVTVQVGIIVQLDVAV